VRARLVNHVWYDPVILADVKTAISIPDATFARVEEAAARLGVSRSEFFTQAAERWLAHLADAETTIAIDRVLDEVEQDIGFVGHAASATAARDAW
jgi:hypothetical protein